VLAVSAERIEEFQALCERERCPFEVLGEATGETDLVLGDGYFDNTPIDLPLSLLLGKPPKMLRDVHPHERELTRRRGRTSPVGHPSTSARTVHVSNATRAEPGALVPGTTRHRKVADGVGPV